MLQINKNELSQIHEMTYYVEVYATRKLWKKLRDNDPVKSFPNKSLF